MSGTDRNICPTSFFWELAHGTSKEAQAEETAQKVKMSQNRRWTNLAGAPAHKDETLAKCEWGRRRKNKVSRSCAKDVAMIERLNKTFWFRRK